MVLRKGFTLLELLIILGIICVLAAILVPNFVRARARGQLTACKSNLKNIGTALEMYFTDNQGRYPVALSQLTPSYLKSVPTCPATGKDTYSPGFVARKLPTPEVGCTGYHWDPKDQARCREAQAQLQARQDTSAEALCPVQGTLLFNKSHYTVVCTGHNHAGTGITAPDFPQYTSRAGLVERP